MSTIIKMPGSVFTATNLNQDLLVSPDLIVVDDVNIEVADIVVSVGNSYGDKVSITFDMSVGDKVDLSSTSLYGMDHIKKLSPTRWVIKSDVDGTIINNISHMQDVLNTLTLKYKQSSTPENIIINLTATNGRTTYTGIWDVQATNIVPGFDHSILGRRITFTDTSVTISGTINSWTWDFGDGNTSIEQNPIHYYDVSNNYTVTLTVGNSTGSTGVYDEDIMVDVDSVFADFTYVSDIYGLSLTNTSTTINGIFVTNYLWDFGDGTTSNEENPFHEYTETNTYPVTLTVTDSVGDTDVKTEMIFVDTKDIDAKFSYYISYGQVVFNDLSISLNAPITSWLWDFGDGSTSTEQNPFHTYSLTYDIVNVTLQVTNSLSETDSASQDIQVNTIRWKKQMGVATNTPNAFIRYNSFASNPYGIWVAVSQNGYASRSDNNGANWTTLPTGLVPDATISNIRCVAADNNGVFIAVGENGFAARSEDHGLTWEALPQGLNSGGMNLRAIDTDKNGVWVAMGYDKCASRSADNGLTWNQLSLPVGENVNNINGIATYNNIWICVSEESYALRSIDNGLTWTVLPKGLGVLSYLGDPFYPEFYAVAATSSGTWMVSGGYDVYSMSTDIGLTWSGNQRYSSFHAHYYDVSSNGLDTFIMVGDNFYGDGYGWRYNTQTGWTELPPKLGIDTGHYFSVGGSPSNVWIMEGNEYPGYSNDNGVNWIALPYGLSASDDIVCNGIGYANGTFMHGGLFPTISTDSGLYWSNQVLALNAPVPPAPLYTAITGSTSGQWVAVSQDGDISHSTNNGMSWIFAGNQNLLGNASSVTTDSNNIWVAVSTTGYAKRSTDGLTWSALPQGLNSGNVNAGFNSIAFGSPVLIAVADDGYASRSVDNGLSWEALPQGLNSGNVNANFTSIATDKAGTWITVAEDGYVVRSADNGMSWNALPRGLNSGLVTTNFRGIATNDMGLWVAVGDDGYAAQSKDNGATWSVLPRGLESGKIDNDFKSVATSGSTWIAAATTYNSSRGEW
jgi:PKD repeat protein